MQAIHTEGEGYDRRTIRLPGVQDVLAAEIGRLTDTPIIVVLIHGGPVDVQQLQESHRIDAILTAWFPGQVSLLASALNIVQGILGKVHTSAVISCSYRVRAL